MNHHQHPTKNHKSHQTASCLDVVPFLTVQPQTALMLAGVRPRIWSRVRNSTGGFSCLMLILQGHNGQTVLRFFMDPHLPNYRWLAVWHIFLFSKCGDSMTVRNWPQSYLGRYENLTQKNLFQMASKHQPSTPSGLFSTDHISPQPPDAQLRNRRSAVNRRWKTWSEPMAKRHRITLNKNDKTWQNKFLNNWIQFPFPIQLKKLLEMVLEISWNFWMVFFFAISRHTFQLGQVTFFLQNFRNLGFQCHWPANPREHVWGTSWNLMFAASTSSPARMPIFRGFGPDVPSSDFCLWTQQRHRILGLQKNPTRKKHVFWFVLFPGIWDD